MWGRYLIQERFLFWVIARKDLLMEAYQVAVAALADRRCTQDEFLRVALERRANEDRQERLAAQAGADLMPGAVDLIPVQPQ